jgi:hypothetical protein
MGWRTFISQSHKQSTAEVLLRDVWPNIFLQRAVPGGGLVHATGGKQSRIEIIGTHLMSTTVGNFETGQKEARNPASCEPAVKRNTTALALSASATCIGGQKREAMVAAGKHTSSSVK